MWKIPLLTVLQYLESDCNDFESSDVAKVLDALVIISSSEILADEFERVAEDYRNDNYSYTALQELMEKIISYD